MSTQLLVLNSINNTDTNVDNYPDLFLFCQICGKLTDETIPYNLAINLYQQHCQDNPDHQITIYQ